jgi:hypothetical protein
LYFGHFVELVILAEKSKACNYNYSHQKVLCNWGWTEEQSSAVHIQALVSADGILLGSSF